MGQILDMGRERHLWIAPSVWRWAVVAALAWTFEAETAAQQTTVVLEDIDSSTTSPTGGYRWLDVADQAYAVAYQESYNYTQADVRVTFNALDTTLHGTLLATGLKPNFAYQLKLVGTPDTPDNERIGFAGRWWQQRWTGADWTSGWNLNNKGDGSFPNPNDLVYLATRDTSDPTSPTGKRYRYTGYLLLDYFTTDEVGNAVFDFEADSSFHVLWKLSQRTHTSDDGPLKESTFGPDPAIHPEYDTAYPARTVTIFGEWERLPMGGVFLAPGDYSCQMILTEESFHGSGGGLAGNWAAAMGGELAFTISTVVTLSGQVTNKRTGTPIRRAKLKLKVDGRRAHRAKTDIDGNYLFEGVVAGAYTLVVTKTRFRKYREELVLDADTRRDVLLRRKRKPELLPR